MPGLWWKEIGTYNTDRLREPAYRLFLDHFRNIFSNLEKKGWVEMEHDKPSKYYPKPPSMTIDITKLQNESHLKTIETVVLEELQPLYEGREAREHPDVWIVRGEFNILAKILEIIENSRKEILVAFPTIPEAAMDTPVPTLKSSTRRAKSEV